MTIHCLMGLASEHKLQSGKACENEIRLLLREANVADDWTVDPILRKNCQVSDKYFLFRRIKLSVSRI